MNRDKLLEVVHSAQEEFSADLKNLAETGFSQDQYKRFLSMQFHLTSGVQRPIMIAASHADLAPMKSLRRFLFEFANEEEPHFEVARKDLIAMGAEPGKCPLDVKLWWAYFQSTIYERPFLRFGATCILENLSGGAAKETVTRLIANTRFLTKQNSRFLEIHRHDQLPHGDQIVEALTKANLSQSNWADLVEGAETGRTLYLRMFKWAVTGNDEK